MDVNTFDVDESIRPQDDFDNYVNKKWKDANLVPDDQVSWGAFNILRDNTLKQLKELLDTGTDDPQFKKITDFFESGMNVEHINNVGIKPLLPILQLVEEINNTSDLIPTIAELQKMGFSTLFEILAEPDSKQPDIVIPHLFTGGLGLPDRDYYFKPEREEIRQKYKDFIGQILSLIGYPQEEAKLSAEKIFETELKLAENTPTNVDRYDPEKYFNKIEIEKLVEKVPGFDWGKYFEISIRKPVPYLSIDKEEFYQTLQRLLESLPIEDWKVFLKYKLALSCAPYLNEEMEATHFAFYGTVLIGQKKMKERWKRVLSYINGYGTKMGEIFGKWYVQKYFPPRSKAIMVELVDNLQKALKKRLLALDWMSQKTKQKALLKYEVFRAKIGYPDKWTDFNQLEINANNTYLVNVLESSRFDFQVKVDKLFQPTDLDEWEMHPQSVNAYFNPNKNEIVFPAAILQYPFFDVDAHEPINYGAIGVVIGHEMTHSYDNHGSKFNHKGELSNWWTEEDAAKFEAKTKYYIEEYGSYTINGKNINGELTLGENIADIGGLKISYDALHTALSDHPTENLNVDEIDREFFLSYGRIWSNNIRPEAVDTQIQTDPHTPAHWRVNGALAHVQRFHEVFNVKEGDQMHRKDIVDIW